MEIGNKTIKRFGKRVRELRQNNRWTQEMLADELEVDRSYISSLERGSRNPTLRTIARIAAKFGISLSELCEGV